MATSGRGELLVNLEYMNLSATGISVHMMGSPMATPELDEAIEVDVATSENLPWMCIVWDDPVNLMSYVSYVFQTVLGYDKKRANELMMQVHTEGKAAVSSGERDKVEADVKKLQVAGLWATMQQAG
ncbi:ATP-dependent Clp protease adaptor protein ClpS [Corynebacterium endometrii]|uniref:ATP-dependent Clp protease adapter protein ClpS n=3 Tax=Corynebacterium TaxID=1716 RepID=A0A4P7QJH9_9CORY|nr:ATP-dependent Clp protease adaptor protein ClpS [Corynebacterium endometrii]